jgi:hypothetical protein
LLRRVPEWIRSQFGESSLADGQPWITFAARDRLAELIRPDWIGFEYGSGGSTLFLSRRIRELVTVEHDPKWAALVSERLRAEGAINVSLHVRPPTAHESEGSRSTDARYAGLTFADYVASIDPFLDASFDFVFIDGRARVGCFQHATEKVRPGGFILLDNSERAEYAAIHAWVAENGWAADHQFGPGPYVDYFWQTSLFTRPAGTTSAHS